MFARVLIANRGEIVLRVARTLRRLGISPVTVYTEVDRTSPHWRVGDQAVALPSGGYLDVAALLDAARATGAEAIHPGYGFLSERADFADAVTGAGLVFIGPPGSAMAAMGDKITAKATVAAAGVPVLEGFGRPGASDDELVAAATMLGFPLLIKPSAGGGGKGMQVVEEPGELPDALQSARHAAQAWFGEGTVFLERFAGRARHIEFQVLLDGWGGGVHLGERECSLQRRHQKLIEEAPSPLLDADRRERIAASALAAARSVGYENAGTVEFLVGEKEFWFLEMNTRLQVEHPVTELVTGIDLVEWQVRIAAGERLGFTQDEVRFQGHAMEARVCAENPARGFLPTGGRIWQLREPTLPDVRVDSGVVEGAVVPTDYDPLLAKVVAWGADRAGALARLDAALAETTILGMATNVGFLRRLLALPAVVSGHLDTDLVERVAPGILDETAPDHVVRAAVLARVVAGQQPGRGLWDRPVGWRVSGPSWIAWRLRQPGGVSVEVAVQVLGVRAEPAAQAVVTRVRLTGDPDHVEADDADDPHAVEAVEAVEADDAVEAVEADDPNDAGVAGTPERPEVLDARAELREGELAVSAEGLTRRYAVAIENDELWIGYRGDAWAFTVEHPASAAAASAQQAAEAGPVRAPMPGIVRRVEVSAGTPVAAGQPLVVVEAMKMEHELVATTAGVVTEVAVQPGQQVALDQVLVVVGPAE